MTHWDIKALVQKAGYADIAFVMMWEDHEVYNPKFDKNDVVFVGLPHFILVKNEKIRWASADEAFAIIDSIRAKDGE